MKFTSHSMTYLMRSIRVQPLAQLSILLTACFAFLSPVHAADPKTEMVEGKIAYYMSSGNVAFKKQSDAIAHSLAAACAPWMEACQAGPLGNPQYLNITGVWGREFDVTYVNKIYQQPGRTTGFIKVAYTCPGSGGFVVARADSMPLTCKRPEPTTPACDACDAGNKERVVKSGNPILVTAQVKEQIEIDYQNASGTLQFVRTYRSDLGKWVHNYEIFGIDYNVSSGRSAKPCYLDAAGTGECYEYIASPSPYHFSVRRGISREVVYSGETGFVGPVWNRDIIWKTSDPVWSNVYSIFRANGETEVFTLDGRLRYVSRNGNRTNFTYSDNTTPADIAPEPGHLIAVTDHFGKSLQFRYQNHPELGLVMSKMVDPDGGETSYVYHPTARNVTAVTYPDGRTKGYLYNEPEHLTNMPVAGAYLTGIVDENNSRFATFKYDGYKAVSTEHAGGVDKVTVGGTMSLRTVTDALGTVRSYANQIVAQGPGGYKLSQVSQPSANGVAGSIATQSYSYDANGNVASFTDFDGSVTVYTNNEKNLEIKRIEAAGTPEARTISTEWKGQGRPLRIAEPKRLTIFTYDEFDNVLTRTVQATSDATGASAFVAAVLGSPRKWTYTYNAQGQVTSETGPRPGDAKVYTYDAVGNLATIANALGHVTTLSGYDNSGRVGKVAEPNGKVTSYSYTPRGWISSIVETAGAVQLTTSFDYDGVGQMLRATMPDGSYVQYTYDAAHRLTGMSDSAGNSVTYTLDNAGNRLSEKTHDINGTLRRQVSRVFNALGQAKQITGGAQ